jgi:hypothetical protein
MTEESALFLGQHALLTAMAVAGPMLMAALIVGSVVSILQAVTQVQEVTLVFVDAGHGHRVRDRDVPVDWRVGIAWAPRTIA